MEKRFIGVIGGLGTDATIRFFEHLNSFDAGKKDEGRRKILLYNNPDIPSRYIDFEQGDEDVKEAVIASIKTLETAGVDFVAIACNTVHYFIDDFRRAASVPVLDIIEETRDACLRKTHKDARIGILGSQKTIATGLYQKAFEDEGIRVFVPTDEQQAAIDMTIDKVKRNDTGDFTVFQEAVHRFREKENLDTLVLGCTELCLIPSAYYPRNVRLVDSNHTLAESAYLASIGKKEL